MTDGSAPPVPPDVPRREPPSCVPFPGPEGAARPAGEVPVFDRAVLERHTQGHPGIAGEMILTFLENAPKQIRKGRAALEAGDMDALRREVHSLKGAASYLGALAFRRVTEEAERAVETGTTEGIVRTLEGMADAFDRLRRFLQDPPPDGIVPALDTA